MVSLNGTTRISLTTIEAFRQRKESSRPIVAVEIPELGDGDEAVVVHMRAMSGSLREAWQLRTLADQQYEPDEELRKAQDRQKTWGEVLRGSKVSLVAQSIVDPDNGRRIFEYAEDELAEFNAAAIERMYAMAVLLNGLPRTQLADYLKDWLAQYEHHAAKPSIPLEDTVKNLPAAPTDSGSLDSV